MEVVFGRLEGFYVDLAIERVFSYGGFREGKEYIVGLGSGVGNFYRGFMV